MLLERDPKNIGNLTKVNKLNLKQINNSKAAQLRSKAQWIHEGERNTKYFLTLENNHWQQKIMSEIKVEEYVISNQDQTMGEQLKLCTQKKNCINKC